MSSPMFDLPEHLDMPINSKGEGPAEGDEIDRVVCWNCLDEEWPCKGYLKEKEVTEAEELIEWFRNDSKTANGYSPGMMRRVIEAFDKVAKDRESKAWTEGLETGFHSSFEGHNGEYWTGRGKVDPLETEKENNPYA